MTNKCSVDGALDKWMPMLFSSLTADHPEPVIERPVDSAVLPPSRIIFRTAGPSAATSDDELLRKKATYHRATVRLNDRVTAKDWSQDVRHIEFDFEDDIRFVVTFVLFTNLTVQKIFPRRHSYHTPYNTCRSRRNISCQFGLVKRS